MSAPMHANVHLSDASTLIFCQPSGLEMTASNGSLESLSYWKAHVPADDGEDGD